jgi:hypothetical protein
MNVAHVNTAVDLAVGGGLPICASNNPPHLLSQQTAHSARIDVMASATA